MGKYDDIIHLPHHVSTTRHHMSMSDRAAQFQPFRALSGFEDAVRDTARPTVEKIELMEDEKALLDARLRRLADNISSLPFVTLTYFQPDKKKAGGAYVRAAGQLKKIDIHEGTLILAGDQRISIEDIVEIQ